MRYASVEEAFDALQEESVEEWLRRDAGILGMSWHNYCYVFGIVGDSQERKIRRHEVQFDPTLLDGED